MAVASPASQDTSRKGLQDGAGQDDVVNCFLLVLGRKPGRPRDVEAHLDIPILQVMTRILASREFRNEVLPKLDALAGDEQQRQMPAALAYWVSGLFGPPARPGLTLWPRLLAACLSSSAFRPALEGSPDLWGVLSGRLPALAALFEPPQQAARSVALKEVLPVVAAPEEQAGRQERDGRSGEEPAQSAATDIVSSNPEAGSAEPAGSEAAQAAAPAATPVARLLLAGEADSVPAVPELDIVMEARRIVLLPEFEARVLTPLATGGMPAGMEAGAVPEELRTLAADAFLGGRLLLGAPQFEEPWPRFLLRLLRHPDSLLRPDPVGWAEAGLPEAAVRHLLTVCEATFSAVGRRDAVVAAPGFLASPDPLGSEALFRYVLGRAPTPRDNLVDMARRGFLNTLLRFLLAPEFERVALWPLRAGKPLRHATGAGLEAAHLEALSVILGRPPEVPEDWAQDLALTLGEPGLLAALAALPADPAQDEARAFTLAELARLRAEVAEAPTPRLLTDLREDRKLCVSAAGLPPGTRLVAELALSAPEALVLRAEAPPDAEGEAVLLLPVAGFDPHVWLGRLTVRLLAEDGTEGEELAPPRPVRVALNAQMLGKLRTRLEEETRRGLAMAEGGRLPEARALLERLLAELPGYAPARLAAAALAMLAGDAAAAEALLGGDPAEADGPELAELRGRIALRQGRFEEAVAAFAEMGERKAGPRQAALALLEAACRPPGPTRPVSGTLPQLREEALALLRNPAAPALPLASALAAARVPEAAGLAREVAAALALGFAPAPNLGEYLRELDAAGLLTMAALLEDAELRELRHLLAGAFAALPPARIPDAGALLAAARILDAEGRAEEALPFAEAAVRLAPSSLDARLVAGQLCRRLRMAERAVAHLEEALRIKPGDARVMERLLAFEIEAQKQDPLRPAERQDRLTDRLLESMQKALVKAPRSPEARLAYAGFALTAERLEEATDILHSLVAEDPGWAPPVNLLVRIAQARNDHAGVLDWTRRLAPEDMDERALVAAAKAHRALGEVEAAQALLAAHLHQPWPTLRREHVRNLFFGARFEEAAQEADRLLAEDRHDLELRFLAAAAALELGRNEQAFFHAAWIQMHGGSDRYPLEMPLFLYAALHRNGDTAGALAQLDPMFARVGAQRLTLDPRLGEGVFDRLSPTGTYPAEGGPNAPVFDGPKVSVVMTTWNVRDYVRTAVRSVLQQSYRNLELIIVDDASTDGTPAILAELERSDPRIKLILKSTNDGTYVSKNLGLLQAQGEFAAFQDSDDWSHPDRLGCSVGALLRRPEVVGLTTDWLRMTTPGDIVIKAGGQISHLCCISLVFRRAPVLDRIGFFDSVRIAADLELIQRLGLAFGARAVPRLRWPLLFGRARSDSLTASEEFGLSRTGFTEPRELYHRNADAFHGKVAAGASPYIPFPLRRRPFDAPAIILPMKAKP